MFTSNPATLERILECTVAGIQNEYINNLAYICVAGILSRSTLP